MNEASDDDAVEVLKSGGYADACEIDNEDCGGSYPGATSMWPAVFQIDHILGRGVKFTEASVAKVGGSDHYPVVAQFQF